MRRLFLLDYHDALLHHWRRHGGRSRAICHLDAHCDLRGLVAHRPSGQAGLVSREDPRPSNFLAIAAAEGWVERVRWLHDRYSGRARDTFTLLFARELEVWPFRRHADAWCRAQLFPFDVEIGDVERFEGTRPGESLDIDWDLFFHPGKPQRVGERQLQNLLELPWSHAPEEIYLCASPDYATNLGKAYTDFAGALATRLGAEIERLPEAGRRQRRQATWYGRGLRRLLPVARNALLAVQGQRFK